MSMLPTLLEEELGINLNHRPHLYEVSQRTMRETGSAREAFKVWKVALRGYNVHLLMDAVIVHLVEQELIRRDNNDG